MKTWDWLVDRFELSRGESGGNVRPMEGMRGYAVLLVFLVHFASLVEPWLSRATDAPAFTRAVLAVGYAGVELFFVLSGYLIYGSLIRREQPYARFMARRVQRLYPAFTVVFLMYVVLSFAFPSESKLPADRWHVGLYLLQNYLMLPGLFDIRPMITVAWSLSYEMFYYVVMPLIIAAFGLRRWGRTPRVAFFALVVLAFEAWCIAYGGPVDLGMFVVGVFLFEAMEVDGVPSPSAALGTIAFVGSVGAMVIPLTGFLGTAVRMTALSVCYFLVCLTCFRSPSCLLARVFSWTPLRWLGNMSYSYYLLHGLALKGAFVTLSALHPPAAAMGLWYFWALLPPMFAFTLVPASLLFLFVERPFSLAPGMGGPASRRPEGG